MQIYMVYGITDCPACLRACAALMEANLEYVFVETDFAPSYRAQLKKQHRRSTFPIIVRRSKADAAAETLIIGGYDELTRHLNSKGAAHS
jgi:glutaredoxin